MLNTNGMATKQKILMFNLLEDLRTQSMLESENSSNVEVRNMWGQRDLHTVLKDRSDKITNLEKELDGVRNDLYRLELERKQTKTDALESETAETYREIIEAKNKEISEMDVEILNLRTAMRELETKSVVEKEAVETLKKANKKLTDLTNRKMTPVMNREILQDVCRALDAEQELGRLRMELARMETEVESERKKRAILEERLRITDEQSEFREKRIKIDGVGDRLKSASDTEAALIEELDSIVNAYDGLLAENKRLEENHSETFRKLEEFEAEIVGLRSRVRMFEEMKVQVEREKRRLGEWKDGLQVETKNLEETMQIVELESAEKDRKMNEYKTLLMTLESNVKMLENEISVTAATNRQAQSELISQRKEMKLLQVEHQDMKRVCETYKKICTADIDVVEESERYKRILRCSLCDTNMKNCVISKCMHTFCDLCLNDRIRARQRKCPTCQIDFSSADIKKVYL